MKINKNKINRAGRKVYRISADHKTKKADHLEDTPPERVKMNYNSGMVSADRGELGTWTIRERYNLNSSEKFKTFEEAAQEFEKRTNQEPPRPTWKEEQ